MPKSPTQTVYVVDEDGGTFVFAGHRAKRNAEKRLVFEAWTGAVHLTITEAEAPTGLSMDDLVTWCIAHVPPTTCEVQ